MLCSSLSCICRTFNKKKKKKELYVENFSLAFQTLIFTFKIFMIFFSANFNNQCCGRQFSFFCFVYKKTNILFNIQVHEGLSQFSESVNPGYMGTPLETKEQNWTGFILKIFVAIGDMDSRTLKQMRELSTAFSFLSNFFNYRAAFSFSPPTSYPPIFPPELKTLFE